MTPYADAADLAHYMNPDAQTPEVPPLATVLLRSAQQLVLDAIAGAVYRVDANEHATDVPTHDAIKGAILEQASAWQLGGVDPRKGAGQAPRQVASKSLLGGSVSYVADPARDTYLSDLASGQSLVYSAWIILRNAGLITNRVNTGGSGVERFNISQRAYDPVTGVLEP